MERTFWTVWTLFALCSLEYASVGSWIFINIPHRNVLQNWCLHIILLKTCTNTRCSSNSNNKELNFAYYLLEIISYFFSCKFWNARNKFESWKTFVNSIGYECSSTTVRRQSIRNPWTMHRAPNVLFAENRFGSSHIVCWMKKMLNWIELDLVFGRQTFCDDIPKCLLLDDVMTKEWIPARFS